MPAIRNERSSKQHRASPFGQGPLAGTASARVVPGSGMAGGTLPTLKKHGQHMLKNPGIVDKILKACDLKPSDTVMEIGPGTGNMTMQLLDSAKRVVAFEIDPRMGAEVKKRALQAGKQNLTLNVQDVLRSDWPVFDVCAANLPYQISSPFTFRLLAHKPFRCAVLMYQKEFGERLVAPVGTKQYGRLALNTQLFVKVSCVCKVSRGSFNPPPEVDSMVVKMVPRNPALEVDFREWDGMLRMCFSRKNKTLRASFTQRSCLETLAENHRVWSILNGKAQSQKPFKDLVVEVLNAVEMADKRAIALDMEDYFKLLLEFNKAGVHFSNVKVGQKIGAHAPDESLFEDGNDGMDE